MKVKDIPKKHISEFIDQQKVDECESKITLKGEFWIVTENLEILKKELEDLTNKYRI